MNGKQIYNLKNYGVSWIYLMVINLWTSLEKCHYWPDESASGARLEEEKVTNDANGTIGNVNFCFRESAYDKDIWPH